jgi:hypothetical protein
VIEIRSPEATRAGGTSRDQLELELDAVLVVEEELDEELDESDVELPESELPDELEPDESDDEPDELDLLEPERLSVL